MVDELRSLYTRVKELERKVAKITATQVWGKTLKDESRAIVDQYFRRIRIGLPEQLATGETIGKIDNEMHAILDSTHKYPSVQKLKMILRRTSAHLLAVEKEMLLVVPAIDAADMIEHADAEIIETLGRLLPGAALSYKQAVEDLNLPSRYSWRGPAADLRETLREVLDYLAPDGDVTDQPGYRAEKDSKGPTMKQKVKFVLSKRGRSKSAIEAPAEAASAVDEALGSFVRSVYSRSSLSAHTPSDKNEVARIRNLVRVALLELLELA